MASTPDRDAVLNALRAVVDPDLRKDIVSLGFVKDLTVAAGRASFTIELTTPACPVKDQMREQARQVVAALPGAATCSSTWNRQMQSRALGCSRA